MFASAVENQHISSFTGGKLIEISDEKKEGAVSFSLHEEEEGTSTTNIK